MPKETKTISVRIDKDVINQFEAICKTIGLTTSDAVNIFVRKVIIEKGIPFPCKDFNKK